MRKTPNYERGALTKTCQCCRSRTNVKLEESIYHATAATDFLATFEKMLFVLNSDEGKEALAGKKQVLLSIISLKRGEKHTHSGKAVWTKEVAQVFGKVLESLPDA